MLGVGSGEVMGFGGVVLEGRECVEMDVRMRLDLWKGLRDEGRVGGDVGMREVERA